MEVKAFPQRFIILAGILLQVSEERSSVTSLRSSPEIVRHRRQVCSYGIYLYEGLSCCKCAPGQEIKKHCTEPLTDGECVQCMKGTYNNNRETCSPCTSCSHANANLEVAEQCTPKSDTKCRCKPKHYCRSFAQQGCVTCDPCSTCDGAGVKEHCTESKDTVCSEDKTIQSVGNRIISIIIAIIVSILLILVVFFVIVCKRGSLECGRQKMTQVPTNGIEGCQLSDIRNLRVPNVEIKPHLFKISDEIGWKDMKHIAALSGFTDAAIESCKLDNPGDAQEQTLQLLNKWVEQHGRDSASELIQKLEKSGKKAKAERIRDILLSCDSAV